MPTVRVGQKVLARDKRRIWYAAQVIDQRGKGANHQLKVHFQGWKARFDEWLRLCDIRKQSKQPIEKQLAEANWDSTAGHDVATDTWEVDHIVDKRVRQAKTQYLVRWAGWEEASDSWEPRDHLSASLVAEFEAKHGNSRPVKPVEKDMTPYTSQFAASAAAAQLDVTSFVDAFARSAMSTLLRAKDASLTQLYQLDPCPPELYLKIHEHLRSVALDLQLQGDAAAHVSPVRAKAGMAGGDQVTDVFTINSTDVVEKLVGEFNSQQGSGALVVSERTSALKMLLPKVHFYFKTTRSGHKPRVHLVVKGHIGALLPPAAGLAIRWSFAKQYPEKKKPKMRHAFKVAFKVAAVRDHLLMASVSQEVRDFISLI